MQSPTKLPTELMPFLPADYRAGRDIKRPEGRSAAEQPMLNPWLDNFEPPKSRLASYDAGDEHSFAKPDAWWRSIPAAMSWMLNLLIEGFAAYGEAMHPGFFDAYGYDHVNRDELDEIKRDRSRDRH